MKHLSRVLSLVLCSTLLLANPAQAAVNMTINEAPEVACRMWKNDALYISGDNKISYQTMPDLRDYVARIVGCTNREIAINSGEPGKWVSKEVMCNNCGRLVDTYNTFNGGYARTIHAWTNIAYKWSGNILNPVWQKLNSNYTQGDQFYYHTLGDRTDLQCKCYSCNHINRNYVYNRGTMVTEVSYNYNITPISTARPVVNQIFFAQCNFTDPIKANCIGVPVTFSGCNFTRTFPGDTHYIDPFIPTYRAGDATKESYNWTIADSTIQVPIILETNRDISKMAPGQLSVKGTKFKKEGRIDLNPKTESITLADVTGVGSNSTAITTTNGCRSIAVSNTSGVSVYGNIANGITLESLKVENCNDVIITSNTAKTLEAQDLHGASDIRLLTSSASYAALDISNTTRTTVNAINVDGGITYAGARGANLAVTNRSNQAVNLTSNEQGSFAFGNIQGHPVTITGGDFNTVRATGAGAINITGGRIASGVLTGTEVNMTTTATTTSTANLTLGGNNITVRDCNVPQLTINSNSNGGILVSSVRPNSAMVIGGSPKQVTLETIRSKSDLTLNTSGYAREGILLKDSSFGQLRGNFTSEVIIDGGTYSGSPASERRDCL